MEAILEAVDLTFAYPGRQESLKGVSFRIARGERVALLGANGSGKSTLLYLLDGLYFPSAGEVRALGQTLTEGRLQDPVFAPRFRREVGLLFQNSEAQLFCPTVEEDVAFGPLQAGWPREEVARRVEEALALLEIQALRKRPPGTLSSGEKKKAALASLLVLSPSVLLLDEPTTGLDPRSQSTLLEILEALGARGMTLLTATHDLAAVPHVADRVLVLSPDHRLAADGPVEQVLADTELLEASNLVHAHTHRHGSVVHRHPHLHTLLDHHHREGE
ncbi:MAG: energy-coupling factor ABC transporter ATP-binding protein [Acidobacteriota bacterium]